MNNGTPIFIDLSQQFIQKNAVVLDTACARMVKDIELVAKETVPIKEGELSDAIKAEKLGMLEHRVVVDKEYAAAQETGQRRYKNKKTGKTKMVYMKRYTTPNTGKHFLINAAKQVVKDALNYLKQAVHSV